MKKVSLMIISFVLIIVLTLSGCEGMNLDNVNLDKINEFTQTKILADKENEVNTIFQTVDKYSSNYAIPTDGVMVFSNGYNYIENQIKDWTNRGYKSVGVMVPIGRDHGSYYIRGAYDGTEHKEIIQMNSKGGLKDHPTDGDGHKTYYVLPTDGYSEFVAEYCLKGLRAGADSVYIEEPDGWIDWYYNDAFKDFWQEEYGEEFTDPALSPENTYKADKLVSKMYTKSFDLISTKIKEEFPDAKVYICTHSISNYLLHGISSNNIEFMNLENIDGVVAQAWTDTSLAASFPLNGVTGVHAFEYSYMEYSELINTTRANGKEFFTLSDPKSDNPALLGQDKEELLKRVYTENIIAQLINPRVNKFEVLPWPHRAFHEASYNYKGLQETMFKLSNDAHTQDAIGYAGSSGIGVVTSYSAISNGHDQNTRASYTTNALTALSTSLITQGIPVEMLSLEGLTSTNYLKGINTLILSYDFVKPDSEIYNKTIADWVKKGGTLIYVGGSGLNANLKGWWNSKSFNTPQNSLFNLLGLDAKNFATVTEKESLNKKVKAGYLPQSIESGRGIVFTGAEVGKKANVLYKSGDKDVVFEQEVDDGLVIFAGVNPSYFGSGAETHNLLTGLVARTLAFKKIDYNAPKMMYTIRGNLEIYKTFDREYSLTGSYVDLTNENYKVLTNPKIEKNSYALLYKLDTSSTNVGFANGGINNVKNEESFSFTSQNIFNSKAQAIVHVGGKKVKSVTLKDALFGQDIPSSNLEFEVIGNFVYITYKHSGQNNMPLTNGSYPIEVFINWEL